MFRNIGTKCFIADICYQIRFEQLYVHREISTYVHIPEEPVTITIRKVIAMCVDARVHKCGHVLQNQTILAKLSAGDMDAQDAKCHYKCFMQFHNLYSIITNSIASLAQSLCLTKKTQGTKIYQQYSNCLIDQSCTLRD